MSERPDGVHWDGIEYVDPKEGRGVLFAFRGSGNENEHAFVLRGLQPDSNYALTFEDGSSQPQVLSGRELTSKGLHVVLKQPETSEIVFPQLQ